MICERGSDAEALDSWCGDWPNIPFSICLITDSFSHYLIWAKIKTTTTTTGILINPIIIIILPSSPLATARQSVHEKFTQFLRLLGNMCNRSHSTPWHVRVHPAHMEAKQLPLSHHMLLLWRMFTWGWTPKRVMSCFLSQLSYRTIETFICDKCLYVVRLC